MPFARSKRPAGRGNLKIRLRSSHATRVRLPVSHRGAETSWRAPEKEADVLHERDLLPADPGNTQRLRK